MTESFYLLGVDPGGGTGFALILVHPDRPAQIVELATCEEDEVMRTLDRLTEGRTPRRVICERFVKREGGYGTDNSPISVSALVNHWCDQHSIPMTKPIPPEKDLMPTRHTLQRLGWWLPGRAHKDEMDAARHVLVYLQRLPHIPTIQVAWPPDPEDLR